MNKAPAGGMVSQVNGQRYEGGEFMPEHGLYCGKGSARLKAADLDAVKAALPEHYRIEWDEKNQVWAQYAAVRFANGTVGEQRQMNFRTAKSLKKAFGVKV